MTANLNRQLYPILPKAEILGEGKIILAINGKKGLSAVVALKDEANGDKENMF